MLSFYLVGMEQNEMFDKVKMMYIKTAEAYIAELKGITLMQYLETENYLRLTTLYNKVVASRTDLSDMLAEGLLQKHKR